MDDQEDLPQPIRYMTVRPLTETSIQAEKSVGSHTRSAPEPQQHDRKLSGEQVACNEPNDIGGVYTEASVTDLAGAAPEAQAPATRPSGLIPDQPIQLSVSAVLAAATGEQSPSLPRFGGGPGGVPGLPAGASHDSWEAGSPAIRAAATEKVRGRAHPMKPVTAQQIAEFSTMWADAAYTLAQMSRRYRCGERTIQDWRVDFGLSPRPEALRRAAQAQSILGAAAGMVDAVRETAAVTQAMAKAPAEGQVAAPLDPALDPMKDPEVVEALNDLRSETRIMSAHSDLTILQRKLARLSVLIATKAPLRSWDSLQLTIESLSRAMLRARQVEATIPRGEHDPVQLRKEAAGQLMKELKSVLSPEDQAALAVIVKRGADLLMAKGKTNETAAQVNGLPGTPAPGHNGKVHPHSAPG